jgi:thiamine-monophosphate kinase
MKLSQLGEFGLIEKIRRRAPAGRGVKLGIGDDAAWIKNAFSSSLVTTDLLLEGIHFDLKWTSLFDLGHKSLTVNLSDIAAMGGIPAYATVSLGIPPNFASARLDEFYRGMNALARKSTVSIIGGDTSVAGSLLISVCLIGHAPYRPISRQGAKVGDDIYVTGTVGDAALALELLRHRSPALRRSEAAYLLKRHHQPTARGSTGVLLARDKLAAAMIDVSDGLLQDLGHICKASSVGAILWEDHLPRSHHYLAMTADSGWALSGGEDYELLFCARRRGRAAIQNVAKQAGVPITRIGACVAAAQGISVLDRNGRKLQLFARGHDHFRQGNTGNQRANRLAK